MSLSEVVVVGAGLAGSELAFQLAEHDIRVTLTEQKPERKTPAQFSPNFAELVCSNSFRGNALTNAVGLLKEEMRRMNSFIMRIGEQTRVPAGGAFAVDRERFSQRITEALRSHKNINVETREVESIPTATAAKPVILATGPLTGDSLARELQERIGSEHLAYYDAIAPIIEASSIDESKVFRASRWDKGEDDAYVNCPLTREQYEAFVAAIRGAETAEAKSFENVRYFEGCLPIEVMAERGERTLAFGPMKPVGLTDPRTGRWPYAVVQLRPEDVDRSAFNMVGFQSRMKWPEQKRVFAMIPGLENAEFQRFGSVHRNTFVNAPKVLQDNLALMNDANIFLAGQITGVEGYVESAASGLMLARMLIGARSTDCSEMVTHLPPVGTAHRSLYEHLRRPRGEKESFQPSNVVFSMFPPLPEQTVLPKRKKLGKEERATIQADRALAAIPTWSGNQEASA